MAIDRAKFFAGIRNGPFPGTLSQDAVTGISAVLDEWERRGLKDLRWLAYMLATVLAECGRNMLPVREGFQSTDAGSRAFVKRKGYAYARVHGGHVYYGRGLSQLTWIDNYRKMSAILGIDLVAQPDRALEPAIAAKILFEGMIRGTFTGKKLADYFTGKVADWRNARRIVNAMDRADEIAGYGKQFHADLVAADRPTTKDIIKDAAKDAAKGAGAGGVGSVAEQTTAPAADGVSLITILVVVLFAAAVVFAASLAYRWWKARQDRQETVGATSLAAVADALDEPAPQPSLAAIKADLGRPESRRKREPAKPTKRAKPKPKAKPKKRAAR